MYVYPWALYDLGPDAALDAMSASGIDAIQLALSYHIGTYLSPRNPRRRVFFGEHGALYFDANAVHPGGWPFPPPISRMARDPSYASTLLHAADQRNLGVAAWVVYLYNHTLARRLPHLAVRNVYGDRNAAQLYPANPIVQRYALTLTRAVLELGKFQALHVESLEYLPYDYGFLNPKAAVAPSRDAKLLLSLCFCSHCKAMAQAAGVAVDPLVRALRGWIDDHLNRLPDGVEHLDTLPLDELQRFMSVREERVLALQRAVLSLATEAGLSVGSSIVEPDDLGVNGQAGDVLRAQVDELRVKLVGGMAADDLGRAVASARHNANDKATVYAFYHLGLFESEAALVGAIELALERGIRHHRFYEFSLLSRRQLEWLSHAQQLWTGGDGA